MRRLRHTSLRDQFEVRLALEIAAARIAAVRHTSEDIDHLHAVLDARGHSPANGDKAAFVARDYNFHRGVVAASRNPALIHLYEFFSDSVNETIASTLGDDIPEPDMAAHRAIVYAIATRDPGQADRTMRTFMKLIFKAFEGLLGDV